MEATFTAELANQESPTYKFAKALDEKKIFVTLKCFNFLLSVNEEERWQLVELSGEKKITSVFLGEYRGEITERIKKEFVYSYPTLKEEDLGYYGLGIDAYKIYTPNNISNLKAYMAYVEVPTPYVTIKGLVNLNFDVDRAGSFIDNYKFKDFSYCDYIMGIINIQEDLLLIKYLL